MEEIKLHFMYSINITWKSWMPLAPKATPGVCRSQITHALCSGSSPYRTGNTVIVVVHGKNTDQQVPCCGCRLGDAVSLGSNDGAV